MEGSLKPAVIFLTVLRITNLEEKGLYTDLIRQFRDAGHPLVLVCPEERRYGGKTRLVVKDGIQILYVRSLNIQKTNMLEKGLATISLNWLLLRAVKKHLGAAPFQLVVYSTPPITYNAVIAYLKKQGNPLTYLLLKDIFPQNAVDLGMMKQNSFLHRYFSRVEERLYRLSDRIGCMSEANRKFLLQHHPYIDAAKVEINPNSIDSKWLEPATVKDPGFRAKWNVPENSLVFIYGGNLGKPQAIPFLLQILQHFRNDPKVYFFIVGDGTEYHLLQQWFDRERPHSARLIKSMPKQEFDGLARNCDVGLIFLDRRFTIPNFPSRLLTYLEYRMAVLAATDLHTDIKETLETNMIGLWSEEGDLSTFIQNVEALLSDLAKVQQMGTRGFHLLQHEYSVEKSYSEIVKHLQKPVARLMF